MTGNHSGMQRVAVVTGASSGIGLAPAERLQRDGFSLGFHTHRDDEDSRARAGEAAARGPTAWVVGDLAEAETPARVVREAVEALGGLDVLVNNAGITVTSVHEHVPRPGFALYASAKAALGMLTRSLALELGPRIRVNAVAPGAIATGRNEEADELDAQIPLGRPGAPEEVAAAVSWLVGEDAAYVSGASILVDGAMAQQVVARPAR